MKKLIALVLSGVMILGSCVAFAEGDTEITVMEEQGEVVVHDGLTKLTLGVDYIIRYENNKLPGTAKVIIEFIGNYNGEVSKEFTIKRKSSGSSSRVNNIYATVTKDDGSSINYLSSNKSNQMTIEISSIELFGDTKAYEIVVEDYKGNKKTGVEVTLKDKEGNEIYGVTDKEGRIILIKPEEPEEPDETPNPTEKPSDSHVKHTKYIEGYEDGTFRPDEYITRAEASSMLSRAIELNNTSENIEFSDVYEGTWFYNDVKLLSADGMIKGYEDGTFRPENKITRAEFVSMLLGETDEKYYAFSVFKDIEDDFWYTDKVRLASAKGYITGYEDGTFRPDAYITRAEVVTIMNKALERTDYYKTENPYSDVESSHWAYKQIIEASIEHEVIE